MGFETIKNKIIDMAEKQGDKIEFNYSLAQNSSIGVGGDAFIYFMPSSVESLISVRQTFLETGKDFIVMGNGTNILIPDEGVEGLVIVLKNDVFTRIDVQGQQVTAGAGAHLAKLISTCIENGLEGLEGLTGIPASVGGAIFMNASYKTAISSVLIKAKVLKMNNEIVEMKKDEIFFDYRKSSFDEKDIILEAVFDLKKESVDVLTERYLTFLNDKRKCQPIGEKTLGCIFKNPQNFNFKAGEMIDSSGMKGVRVGGAVVSAKHANFIVNEGGAKASEILMLMDKIIEGVKGKFSIELEPEIKIL